MTRADGRRIVRAFILAAGMGSRLRPYTDHCPKPLVKVGGKPIIDYLLDALAGGGVREAVVNLHHLGDQLVDHLRGQSSPKITLSWEKDLLDTGGGVFEALSCFQNEEFYVLNGDSFWRDGVGGGVLARLAQVWDPARMDVLILLYPAALVPGGSGDYDLTEDGLAHRSLTRKGDYMFAGVRVAHPRIFRKAPAGAFSFRDLMDAAQAQGRLSGLVHDGLWHHISTPEDLRRIDALMRGASEAGQRVGQQMGQSLGQGAGHDPGHHE